MHSRRGRGKSARTAPSFSTIHTEHSDGRADVPSAVTSCPAAARGTQQRGSRRILVVGAGLSGAAAVWCLQREESKDSSLIAVHCWDGARGCGGRLATARIAANGAEAKANMGTQRLHHTVGDAPAQEVAALLCGAGILEQESAVSGESTASFLGGSNEVCKWLLRGAELRFGARIRTISRATHGSGWEVAAFGDKAPAHFDAVVFSGSVAEVFTTHGDLTALVCPHRKKLEAVQYTRICCSALVFSSSGAAADLVCRFFGENRSRKGAAGSELTELVLQPAIEGSAHLSVVAVSTEQFGQSVKGLRATHRPTAQDQKVSLEVEQTLSRCACALIASISGETEGDLANSAAALYEQVIATKMNFWKFARVAKPFTGADCLVVSERPPLAIVGDYFLGSGGGSVGSFGGCIRSASSAATLLQVLLAASMSIVAPLSHVGTAIATNPTIVRPTAVRSRRVLIVGGGMSGALTAHLLKRSDVSLEIAVWEMARGAGGRMSTTRWGSPTETRANTGAQYLSAAIDGPAADVLSDAMRAGLIEGPLTAEQVAQHSRCFSAKGKDDFRATQGTSAVVKYFLDAADAVHFETRLQSLQCKHGGGWLAVPNTKGNASVGRVADSSQPGWKGGLQKAPEEFDAVVLAMPPKDAARVSGDALRLVQGVQQQTQVKWLARFSIALWFEPRDVLAAEAFVSAAFLAHQTAPQGILDAVVVQPMPETTGSVSVVIQSTCHFWARHSKVHAGGGRGGGMQAGGGASAGRPEHVTGNGRGAVQVEMLAALQALSSGLVMPKIAHVKMLNWRTSQVATPARLTAEGRACVVASHQPSLVLAGDWCAESSFEGCVISAQAAASAVVAALA